MFVYVLLFYVEYYVYVKENISVSIELYVFVQGNWGMYKGVFIELGNNLLDSRLMYCIYNGLSETGDVGVECSEARAQQSVRV